MREDRGTFESEELRGLAERYGGVRQYSADGICSWSFPRWVCPECGPHGGPYLGCLHPLSSHGGGQHMETGRKSGDPYCPACARWWTEEHEDRAVAARNVCGCCGRVRRDCEAINAEARAVQP